MGLFSFIVGAIGSVCSAIGSVCSAIGGVVMKGVSALATGIARVGEMAGGLIHFISNLCTGMGLKPAEEEPQEIGLKAEKCGERPEDYDSVEDYINHLRKDIEIDHEELNKLSEMDKLKYGCIGSALYVKNMEERYNMAMPLSYLKTAQKVIESGNMTEGEVKGTLDVMKEKGIENAESFSNYIEGKATVEEQMVIYDSMKEALHREFPNLSEADLNVKVAHIKDFMKQDKE